MRQTCGASEMTFLEDISSQQMTQTGSFSTHLRNTSIPSWVQILLLNCESQCVYQCGPPLELTSLIRGEDPGELELYPFPLVMKVGRSHYTCHFQSDFHVLKCGLPRMAVVVNPPPLEDEPADGYVQGYRHLLLQGASVVRYLRTHTWMHTRKRGISFSRPYLSTISEVHFAIFYTRQGPMTRYVRMTVF